MYSVSDLVNAIKAQDKFKVLEILAENPRNFNINDFAKKSWQPLQAAFYSYPEIFGEILNDAQLKITSEEIVNFTNHNEDRFPRIAYASQDKVHLLNLPVVSGYNALYYAIYHAELETFNCLIKLGVDTNLPCHNQLPVDFAFEKLNEDDESATLPVRLNIYLELRTKELNSQINLISQKIFGLILSHNTNKKSALEPEPCMDLIAAQMQKISHSNKPILWLKLAIWSQVQIDPIKEYTKLYFQMAYTAFRTFHANCSEKAFIRKIQYAIDEKIKTKSKSKTTAEFLQKIIDQVEYRECYKSCLLEYSEYLLNHVNVENLEDEHHDKALGLSIFDQLIQLEPLDLALKHRKNLFLSSLAGYPFGQAIDFSNPIGLALIINKIRAENTALKAQNDNKSAGKSLSSLGLITTNCRAKILNNEDLEKQLAKYNASGGFFRK